jgi:hypothetical protein
MYYVEYYLYLHFYLCKHFDQLSKSHILHYAHFNMK